MDCGKLRLLLLMIIVTTINRPGLCTEVFGNLVLHSFSSATYENVRMLRIWLPPGYRDNPDKGGLYPVLYLNDGQNLFDIQTSTFGGGEWKVDESVTSLVESGEIPPVIVVGIDHPGKKKRPNEYLPWEDNYLDPPFPEPKGKNYPEFLLEEVIPFVERHYPVRTDPSGRLIGGSSYGALIALYTVLVCPDEFGMLLAESPSLYVNESQVLEMSRETSKWPGRVYLGVGTHEGRSSCLERENREAFDDVLYLERIIREKSPETGVLTEVEACGLHGEEAWARRLPAALRFLLGK